jgi:hypothetical protein
MKSDRESAFHLAMFCAIAPLSIFLTAAQLNAHKVTSGYELTPIALPGASGVVSLDYFTYDRSTRKLWVPASNTGNVDVIDEKSDAVSQVTGFKTGEVELRGRKVPLGPTAVSVGDGVVYIGNRGDSSLCVIDAQTLKREACSRSLRCRLVLRQLRTSSCIWPRQKNYGLPPGRHRSESLSR